MTELAVPDGEKLILDVGTLRYCIECMELQARQCSTSRRSPVARALRECANGWRFLIEECAHFEIPREITKQSRSGK